MASQILHNLIDDVENAWRKVQGIRPQVDTEMRTAIDNARAHAEKLVDDVAGDVRDAGQQIASDVRTDGAPIVTDVESGVRDVAQTGEQAFSGDAPQADGTPTEAPQSAPAEQSDTQPAA